MKAISSMTQKLYGGGLLQTSKALLGKAGIRAEQVSCVCPSTLGSDCLPVDEDCRPLRKAILYGIDSRAQEEISWMTAHYRPGQGKGTCLAAPSSPEM